jgi:hypothetical protein
MSVKALINRSTPVYWELVALEGTPRWRGFIRNACRVGLPVILFVQNYHKDFACDIPSTAHLKDAVK